MAVDPNGPGFTRGLINEGYNTFSDIAVDAIDKGMALVNQLSSAIPDELDINVTYAPIVPLLNDWEDIQKPELPTVEFDNQLIGAIDDDPDVDDIKTPDLADAPRFEAAEPNISYGATPGFFDDSLPAAPSLQSVDLGGKPDLPAFDEVAIPGQPGLHIPSSPVLHVIRDITVPDVVLPTFDSTAPILDVDAPDAQTEWNEGTYTSDVYTTVWTRLNDMVTNGLGLPAAVEQALFDRGRNREDRQGQAEIKAADKLFAARGFEIPPGEWAARVQAARDKARSAKAELNRDLTIQFHTQQLETIRQAVAQGITLEQVLRKHYTEVQDRGLKAAQFAVQSAIDLFNAKVSLTNLQYQSWATEAQVHRDLIQAEVLKLEKVSKEVDVERLKGDLDKTKVDAYTAQLQGVRAQADIYNSQVQATEAIARNNVAKAQQFQALSDAYIKEIQAKLDIQKGTLDIYEGKLRGYTAKADVNRAQWGAWGESVRAESAKAQVFDSLTRAYAARVEAVKSNNDSTVQVARLNLEQNREKIQVYLAQLEAVKARVDAESRRIDAELKIWDGQTRMYTADQAQQIERYRSDSERVRLAIVEAQAKVDTYLKGSDLKITQAQRNLDLTLKAWEAAARTASQIGAGAMSAVNLSASSSVSSSDSYNVSHSYSHEG